MKLIHITDIHLVPPGERLLGLDPGERLKACIRDINIHHSDADLCVITGDLANRGETAAYTLLRERLLELKIPCQLLIGNHDNRENFKAEFSEMYEEDADYCQKVLTTPSGTFLFLDTKRKGSHGGGYCMERQRWLSAQLNRAGNGPVYLFMHHPPFDTGLPAMDRIGLENAGQFAEALAGRNIRHLFFGHLHRPISGSWNGIPFTTIKKHQSPSGL